MKSLSSPLAPVVLTFCAAILWGLWWIPVRTLEAGGMTGAQAGIILNLGAATAVGLIMLAFRHPLRIGPRAIAGGALVGVALSTYSIAFAYSDVVRVILLFYLAPAWSKLIEWAFMGRPWNWSTTFTVGASLAGAILILGGRLSVSAINLGDVLAIISGIAWAIGATFIFTGAKSTAISLTLVTLCMATLVAAGFALLVGESPVSSTGLGLQTAGLAMGAFYSLPVMFATLWSAQRLAPALLSFLFTLEICSGVLSGALLLDEPFGVIQLAGSVLIIGAALSEVAFSLRERRKQAA